MMIMLTTKKIEKRFFIGHNDEYENWHTNYYYCANNKYDGSYRAHDSPAKKLHMIIFILILAEEKFKHWTK